MADDGDDSREVEYLDTAQGAPARAPAAGAAGDRSSGSPWAGSCVAGGAAYGIAQFLGGGASPASAVPDDVFAYLAVDLDPGAGQQVEAYRTLKKFPGIKDELKLSGGDEDLRKAIFEKIADEADCDLSYEDDIDPWLGNSAAMTGLALQGLAGACRRDRGQGPGRGGEGVPEAAKPAAPAPTVVR